MDPKANTNLDPKLKEVYDRVMGTPTGAKPTTPPPPQASSPAGQSNVSGLPPLPPSGVVPPPPLTASTPIPTNPQAGLSKPNGVPIPATPASTTPPPPPPAMRPTVDYAALAAKYATPLPTMDPNAPIPKAPAVTPSTTAYGVVNNDSKPKTPDTGGEKPGGKKKLLLIVGIPVGLLIYTIIWIVVFHVDVMSLLPLPK